MRSVPLAGLILAAFSLPLAAQTTANPNTVVNVCVGTLTGIIREVPNANYCIKGLETYQQFNSTGVQGATGAQGAAGPMGLQGIQGTQGPAGPAGVAGPQGSVGLTGSAGSTGAQGPAGTTGAAGPQGLTGMAGSTGAAGPQGIPGVAGTTGAQGLVGATGLQGPIGLTGATGVQGVAGATGAQGSVGLTGATGAIGSTGAQGIAGVAGKNGATGAQGNAGVAGKNGADGATGAQGVAGPAGPDGATGPAGAGSSLTYTIHYYQTVVSVPGDSDFGYNSTNLQAACPSPEIPIAASCGYQYPVGNSSLDQHNLNVNYAGLGYSSPNSSANLTQSSCLVTNSATNSRNVLVGVSCLASSPVANSSANAQPSVVKSCTYDPDTQSPCTAAEALPATEVHHGVFQSAANAASTNLAQPTSQTSAIGSAQNSGTGKTKQTVTLWFRE